MKIGLQNPHGKSGALFIISTGLIIFQLTLLQLLSYMQWAYFASMIISIALLGWGTAGIAVTFFRDKIIKYHEILLPLFALLCTLSMELSVSLIQNSAVRFDSYLLFHDREHIIRFIITAFLMTLPFFWGAFIPTILFLLYPKKAGKLYAINLSGSGIGGVAAIILALNFSIKDIFLITSLFTALSVILLSAPKHKRYFLFISLSLVVVFLVNPLRQETLPMSQYKNLAQTQNLPGAAVTYGKNTPFGRNIDSPASCRSA